MDPTDWWHEAEERNDYALLCEYCGRYRILVCTAFALFCSGGRSFSSDKESLAETKGKEYRLVRGWRGSRPPTKSRKPTWAGGLSRGENSSRAYARKAPELFLGRSLEEGKERSQEETTRNPQLKTLYFQLVMQKAQG